VNLSPKMSWLPAALMMLVPLSVMAGQITSSPYDLGTLGGGSSVETSASANQLAIAGSSNLTGDANSNAFTWTLNQ
jgi:hypothetical protein